MNTLRTVKTFCWIALLVLGAPAAWGFALLGPAANGGDAYQVVTIGYNPMPGFDSAAIAPKNIGEGYRRNTPVLYYTYDASFLQYFGSNGVVAVDAAFALMNASFTYTNVLVTNSIGVDGYSPALLEFPDNSQHVNLSAYALGLRDLKSTTLHLLIEQMGLINPVRYVFALHDRFQETIPGATCPEDMLYLVVQRNYGIVPSAPNQLQYSSYVNDVLYSYNIAEYCTAINSYFFPAAVLADAVEFPVDPLSTTITPVAAGDENWFIRPIPNPPFRPPLFFGAGLISGGFYTGLTRDDVAGLRALLMTNNVNTEDPVPGALLRGTNSLGIQTIPTQPFGPLLAAALTNDPATLQARFQGLLVSTVTNVGVLATTNITAYYTNQPGSGVTNYLPLLPITTQDYGLLLQQAATNNPATLQALYPGLVFSTVTNQIPLQVVTTNITAYYTNQPGPAVTNFGMQDFLNPPPNSIPSPIPGGWAGTMDFGLFTLQALTNTTGLANNPATAIAQLQALYPGLVVLSATPYFTTVFTTNYITYLYWPIGQPLGNPPIQVTAISGIYTTYAWRYTYVFGNVMLRSNGTFYPFVDYNTSRSLYGTNETVTIQTISVATVIGSPLGNGPTTNTTTTTPRIYGITGDFFILPTNWCGFTVVSPLAITVLNSYSNVVTATGTTNTLGAAQFTQTTIHTYTNRQFVISPGICQPLLQFATNYTTSLVTTYQNTLLNIYTNYYAPTSTVTVITNLVFTTNGAPWGTLYTNAGTNIITVPVPTGDYFLIPTNWCGFTIMSTLLTNVVYTTNTTLTGSVPIFSAPGVVSGLQESYSQTVITSFTNHVLLIQQGICEPLLVLITNVTGGGVVTNYQNTLLNIYTNYYAPTSTVTVVTTNIFTTNGAPVGTLYTNVTTTNVTLNLPTGDYFIIPAAWCGFSVVSTLLTNVVYATNTTLTATAPLATAPGTVLYSQTVITSSTNHILRVQVWTCVLVADVAQLRQGIGKIQFLRADFDSLLSQTFQPVTNDYTVVIVTNSQPVTEFFRRIVTAPDFLFSAQDLASGPNALPVVNSLTRTWDAAHFDQAHIIAGGAGPGTINPATSIVFNKVGNIYGKGPVLSTNAFLGETPTDISLLTWASFDASTNAPVVYPNGSSIANLQSQVLVQVTPPPPTLPDGTNGVAYPTTPFSATGGAFSPAFTWTVVSGLSGQGLPAGLSLAGDGTLSGTPTQTGIFDFTVQLTDSLGRSVNWNYTITIH